MSVSGSQTGLPSDNNGAITQETFNTLKQKYNQLVRKSGKKRRNLSNPTTEERAQGIRKVVSLYTNVSALVAVALEQEEGNDSDTNEVVPEEEQKKYKTK